MKEKVIDTLIEYAVVLPFIVSVYIFAYKGDFDRATFSSTMWCLFEVYRIKNNQKKTK